LFPSTPAGWLLVAAAAASGAPADAQTIVAEVGWSSIGDYVVVSRSNDRSSVCDEYINPNALHVSGCTTPKRGVGDGWSAPFSDGGGLLTGLGIELDIAGPWKLAFDYSQAQAVFDQTVASTDAQGADFEKLSSEVVAGRERLGTLTTRGVHGVLMLYPLQEVRLRPYGGIGVGYAALRADFGWNWRRNADPFAITTGRDQPNSDEIRRNLAGTASTGSVVFSEEAHVLVYVVGVDLAVNDRFSVGLRARRLQYPSLEVGPYAGETLRGHVPNLRLDGSEPVSAWSTLPRTNVTTVNVLLKYRINRREETSAYRKATAHTEH
jgi:opacity protein-like surface antigen